MEGRMAGGGVSFSFLKQDKHGNESVIISRNCLPLRVSFSGAVDSPPFISGQWA